MPRPVTGRRRRVEQVYSFSANATLVYGPTFNVFVFVDLATAVSIAPYVRAIDWIRREDGSYNTNLPLTYEYGFSTINPINNQRVFAPNGTFAVPYGIQYVDPPSNSANWFVHSFTGSGTYYLGADYVEWITLNGVQEGIAGGTLYRENKSVNGVAVPVGDYTVAAGQVGNPPNYGLFFQLTARSSHYLASRRFWHNQFEPDPTGPVRTEGPGWNAWQDIKAHARFATGALATGSAGWGATPGMGSVGDGVTPITIPYASAGWGYATAAPPTEATALQELSVSKIKVNCSSVPVGTTTLQARTRRFDIANPTPTDVIFLNHNQTSSDNSDYLVRRQNVTEATITYQEGGSVIAALIPDDTNAFYDTLIGTSGKSWSGNSRGGSPVYLGGEEPTPLAGYNPINYGGGLYSSFDARYRGKAPVAALSVSQKPFVVLAQTPFAIDSRWPFSSADPGTTTPTWHSVNQTAALVAAAVGGTPILRITKGSGSGIAPNACLWFQTARGGSNVNATTARRFAGYRYVRLRIRSVGGANLPFTFSTNEQPGAPTIMGWKLTTGGDGEWVERVVDLLAPYDAAQSTFGQVSYDDSHRRALNGITLSEMAPTTGTTPAYYELAWIKGERRHESLLSVLFVDAAGGSRNGVARAEQFPGTDLSPVHGFTDGLLTLTGNPKGLIYFGDTLADIGQWIGENAPTSGWECSVLNPVRAGKPTGLYDEQTYEDFMDGEAPTLYLQGAGLSGNGQTCIERDAAGATTLYAEPIFGRPSWYPGAGDWQNGGAYGADTTVNYEALLGDDLSGVVLPSAGTLTVTEETATGEATGTVQSTAVRPSGTYRFGAPYLRTRRRVNGAWDSALAYVVEGVRISESLKRLPAPYLGGTYPAIFPQYGSYGNAGENSTGFVSYAASPAGGTPRLPLRITGNRRRYYLRWYINPAGKIAPYNIASPHGWYASVWGAKPEASGDGGGAIHFVRTANGPPSSVAWAVNQAVTHPTGGARDGEPVLALLASGRLLLSWTRTEAGSGTNVYEAYSDDDGQTWGTETKMADGAKHPGYGVGIFFGDLLRVWYAPSGDTGTLKGRYQEKGDKQPGAEFTLSRRNGAGALTPLTPADDSFRVVQLHEGMARWCLTMIVDGEDTPSHWVSADEGKEWTRLPTPTT